MKLHKDVTSTRVLNYFKNLEEKYNEIHKDKYDYSKVEYKNKEDKIKVICPIHGEFEISSAYHLTGGGCKKCIDGEKYNSCLIEALKYKTRNDFAKYSSAKYRQATRNNWIELITKHMINDRIVYTKNVCEKIALKYRYRKEFADNDIGAYGAARRNGWLKELCGHMKYMKKSPHTRETYENRKTTFYYIEIEYEDKKYYKPGLCISERRTPQKSIYNRYRNEINFKYNIKFFKEFKNGANAYDLEQYILSITSELEVLEKFIIPSGGGHTEVRSKCIINKIKDLL